MKKYLLIKEDASGMTGQECVFGNGQLAIGKMGNENWE